MAGCAKDESNVCVLMNSDFEQFDGWVPTLPPFLSEAKAHSGRYSYFVGAGAEFAGTYHTTLERCGFIPSRLQLRGWTYLSSGLIRATNVVVEVRCHDRRPNIWRALAIDQVVRRYQQWEPITKTILLPSDLEPTDEVWVSVWCPERGDSKYFDDLTLEAWR
ncbi:MAG: hypothetical protein JWP58_10 [Hymenobacter sp.]|nr:hypothetical protein [Hymenobacter sp.]